MSAQESFAARLDRLLGEQEQSGRSANAIATAAGISWTGLDKLRKGGSKNPRSDTTRPLARELGVSEDYLLTGKERGQPELEAPEALIGWVNDQANVLTRTLKDHLQDVINNEARRLVTAEWHRALLALHDEAPEAAKTAVPILERLLGVSVAAYATDRGGQVPSAKSEAPRRARPAS